MKKIAQKFAPLTLGLIAGALIGACDPLGGVGLTTSTNQALIICVNDAACPAGLVCNIVLNPKHELAGNGVCMHACLPGSDAGNGYCTGFGLVCAPEGRCLEVCDHTKTPSGCPAGAPTCGADNFCRAGSAPTTCNPACGANQTCQNGTCVANGGGVGAPCGGNNPACAAGLICSSRGFCSDRSIGQPCNNGADCSTGACLNNVCAKCAGDAHCPGSTCNTQTGVCNNANTCGQGQTLCNGACATLNTDNNNCGGCGVKCAANQTCQNGACGNMMGCGTTGNASCNNTCVDTRTNPSNCGGCGIVCQNGTFCANSACTSDINSLRVRCNDGQKNGDETATDCGGSCVLVNQLCTATMGCMLNSDCWDWGTGVPLACNGSVCVCPQGKTPKTVTGLNGRLVTSCQ